MFPLNFEDLYQIDVDPDGTETFARLAEGLTSGVLGSNDVVDQTSYLDGDGYASSDVTGGQKIITFAGHRAIGDTAQDYIASINNTFGSGRKTTFKYQDSQGRGFYGNATIANIEIGGGDANAKKDISFEIHMNGKPTEIPLSLAPELPITVAGGATSGTTTATATATGTLGYRLSASEVTGLYVDSYLDDYIGYTSGADITATAGQYLTVFDVDANGRVVSYNSYELQAGDITA